MREAMSWAESVSYRISVRPVSESSITKLAGHSIPSSPDMRELWGKSHKLFAIHWSLFRICWNMVSRLASTRRHAKPLPYFPFEPFQLPFRPDFSPPLALGLCGRDNTVAAFHVVFVVAIAEMPHGSRVCIASDRSPDAAHLADGDVCVFRGAARRRGYAHTKDGKPGDSTPGLLTQPPSLFLPAGVSSQR